MLRRLLVLNQPPRNPTLQVGVHHSSYDSTWTVGYQDRVISQMLANYNGRIKGINVDQHRFEQPFAKWGNKGNMSCDEVRREGPADGQCCTERCWCPQRCIAGCSGA